jgi:hypothetical protein
MKRLKGNSPETIQQLVEGEGLWLGGDTRHPDAMVLIVSDGHELKALRGNPIDPLRLNGFQPTATFYGPFLPEDVAVNRDGDEINEQFRTAPLSTIIRDRHSFILGLELAMRIVRNQLGTSFNGQEPDELLLEGIVAMIRLVQVEMGSGRMPLPTFNAEETAEVERIS